MYNSLKSFRKSIQAGRPIQVTADCDYQDLIVTEWSPVFEQLMRNRLIVGALRYGRLNAACKVKYDRINSIKKRLDHYTATRNKEDLVDIANLCLCEFEEGEGIWEPIDDGEHTEVAQ